MVQLRVLIPPGAFGGNDVDAPRHSNKSKFGLFLQVFELQEAKCVCWLQEAHEPDYNTDVVSEMTEPRSLDIRSGVLTF